MTDVKVCTGCWKHGYCDFTFNTRLCRCPCDAGKAWKHTEQVNDERKRLAQTS